MIRLTITAFFVVLSFAALSQTECWECLVAARNLDSKTALSRCLKVSKTSELTTNEREVVSYVIGRFLLDESKPKTALKYLTISEASSDSLLSALSKGLLGDYYFDQKQLEKALKYYEQAADGADNAVFTPYFLNKQGIVYRLKNDREQVDRIGSRLKVNHKQFFQVMELSWLYGNGQSKYDSLNRSLVNAQLPKGPYGVGLINGEKVDLNLFLKEVRYYSSIYEQGGELGIPAPDQDEIQNEAWNNLTQLVLLARKEKTFALNINNNEFHAYLFAEKGYNLLPDIEQAFSDPDGTFRVKEFEAFLSERDNETDPELKANWLDIQQRLKAAGMQEKYLGLLALGFHMGNVEAAGLKEMRKNVLHVRGIRFPVDYFPDSLFTPTETEVQTYFEKHKADGFIVYPAQRRINYLRIPITANSVDSAAFLKKFEGLKEDFRKTANDSLFVTQHADISFYAPHQINTFLPEGDERAFGLTYPIYMKREIENAQIGDVIGPYIDQDHYRLAKVVGFNDNQLTVRHILISSGKSDPYELHEQKRKEAEELAKKITHDNFEEYVVNYSEDPGSNDRGGIYSDFLDYQMVQPFSDYAVNAPIGEIGVVETDYGFHIMEVLERKAVKYPKLAIIDKKLTPTKEIQDSIAMQVAMLHKKMLSDFKNLNDHQKEAYIDSLRNTPMLITPLIIHEENPSANYFMLPETGNQVLRYAYSKNVQRYQLFEPIYDSTYWIIPIFDGAFSGEDYNFEQTKNIFYFYCLHQKKWDAMKAEFDQLQTLDEIAAKANLEVVEQDFHWNTHDLGWYMAYNIYQDYSLHPEHAKGLNWTSDNYSMAVYEITSVTTDETEVSLSEIKQEFQYEQLKPWFGNERFMDASKSTIYNYKLYKLLLRL